MKTEEQEIRKFASWLDDLSARMKSNPEEFIDVDLEWIPDPINQYFFGSSSLDRGGYFAIKFQKISHK